MTDYKAERAEAWREELRKSIPAKDRTNLERVEMPMQDAVERRSNNLEVNLGLTEEMAVKESHRCLDCANPTCVTGCPVNVNIPKFIKKIFGIGGSIAWKNMKRSRRQYRTTVLSIIISVGQAAL